MTYVLLGPGFGHFTKQDGSTLRNAYHQALPCLGTVQKRSTAYKKNERCCIYVSDHDSVAIMIAAIFLT